MESTPTCRRTSQMLNNIRMAADGGNADNDNKESGEGNSKIVF